MTMLPVGQVAPVSRRVVAVLIDGAIAAGLAVIGFAVVTAVAVAAGPERMLMTVLLGGGIVALLLLGWWVVYSAMQAGAGSVGMRSQRLQLRRRRDGRPIGVGAALLRNLVFAVTGSIVVGYFSPLFDGSGRFQGWHDRAVGAVMVDARVPAAMDEQAQAEPHPAPASAPAATSIPEPAAVAPAPVAPVAVAPDAVAPVAVAPDAAAGLIAFVPGITSDAPPPNPAVVAPPPLAVPPASPPPKAAPPPEAAPPAGAPAEADDVDELEDTRISIPGHRLVFIWDDGTRVAVSRRTVFGRNPEPEAGAVIVPVRDETLSLSKTHFEAEAEASGGWVTDRHSTNGTTVVRDGERHPCPPGERVRIRLGDAIEIGDRIVTIGGYA